MDGTDTSWREVEIGGEFLMRIPPRTAWDTADGGLTLILKLPTVPRTELLVSRHSLPREWEPPPYLLKTVRGFFHDVVAPISKNLPGISVETLPQDVHGCAVVQGIAADEADDVYWFVRAYAVGTDYLWLQWTCPKRLIEDPVLAIMESVSWPRRP
jgi:hypothetical protein